MFYFLLILILYIVNKISNKFRIIVQVMLEILSFIANMRSHIKCSVVFFTHLNFIMFFKRKKNDKRFLKMLLNFYLYLCTSGNKQNYLSKSAFFRSIFHKSCKHWLRDPPVCTVFGKCKSIRRHSCDRRKKSRHSWLVSALDNL